MGVERTRRKAVVESMVVAALLGIGVVDAGPAQAAAPTVGAFAPISGSPGTSVIIAGVGFNDASVATAVAFHGTTATFSVDSNVQITATVPAGATTGTISVGDSEGTGTSLLSFTVTAPPAPVVTSFLPVMGPIGTSVMITGTGFTGASSVTFNGTSATFIVDSATQIHATVPSGATTGKISVVAPGGTAASATNFTVSGSAVPSITSFTPTSGDAGTSVAITGTSFTGTTSVTFNGTSATFTVDSDTTIHATVPSGATTGKISVVTPGGTATSLTDFTVGAGGLKHPRAVRLHLKGHLKVSGRLSTSDTFTGCVSNKAIKIQWKGKHGWRIVASGTTDASGRFAGTIRNRRGRYRAVAPAVTLNNGADVCKRAVSAVQHHP